MVTVVCLLATVLITTCLATMLPVDYTKQNEWVGVCNVEGAVKQSPIDVITPGTCTKLGDTVIEFPGKYLYIYSILTKTQKLGRIDRG